MASEASRRKYPDVPGEGDYSWAEATEIARTSYDEGRVDALREAASKFFPRGEAPSALLHAEANRIEEEATR